MAVLRMLVAWAAIAAVAGCAVGVIPIPVRTGTTTVSADDEVR